MQQAAERALTSQLDAIEAGVYSKEKFPGRTTYRDYMESSKASGEDHGPYTPYLQGALVAIETGTGYVRAMVGGRDFDDSKYNRATQAIRQPGSTFKPFVYAAAIRAGHPVTEMLDDSPLNPPVVQLDSTPWQPKDYDDTTLGLIPMRQSLYLSRNLSTIKLGMALGEQTVVGEARRYGITTPLRAYPSLHIGANGVRPIEIVAAYTGFATLGTRAEPVGILRVEDRQGNILWQPQVQREQVMDPEHSWLLLDMMRDVMRCQPGTGPWRCGTAAGAVAGLSVPMAGKTGTTDDYTDAWFVGFTPELVAGLLGGYDPQQRIMNKAPGGRLVAPAPTMVRPHASGPAGPRVSRRRAGPRSHQLSPPPRADAPRREESGGGVRRVDPPHPRAEGRHPSRRVPPLGGAGCARLLDARRHLRGRHRQHGRRGGGARPAGRPRHRLSRGVRPRPGAGGAESRPLSRRGRRAPQVDELPGRAGCVAARGLFRERGPVPRGRPGGVPGRPAAGRARRRVARGGGAGARRRRAVRRAAAGAGDRGGGPGLHPRRVALAARRAATRHAVHSRRAPGRRGHPGPAGRWRRCRPFSALEPRPRPRRGAARRLADGGRAGGARDRFGRERRGLGSLGRGRGGGAPRGGGAAADDPRGGAGALLGACDRFVGSR